MAYGDYDLLQILFEVQRGELDIGEALGAIRQLTSFTPTEASKFLSRSKRKPKRKLSAWNKYVKNKRNHITYRDGKLNLKKMAVAFRRKRRK